ncbi:MAG: DNA repair protein RecN [Muribaculaceae bacterium]|nr:DNA repair protein RecN [Muribaculaceae bacterium]
MIESLHISNYALIDRVDIDFEPGLNIITGETGAGKSIMLGALSLLMGERADSRVVTDLESKSVIEASFSVKNRPELQQYFLENDIEWDDTQCILRREILPNGRSRAFINDSPVNLDKLKYVALTLVDIHSQHQNLLLASPPYQLRILDVLAGNGQRLEEYEKRYQAFRKAVKEFVAMRREIEKANADEEFTRYQLEKIERLNLLPGEQEELERERELMANMTDVKQSLDAITDSLSNANPSALSLLKEAIQSAGQLSGVIEEADSLVDRLEAARVEIRDIADTFADYESELNADPARLQEVEQRLNDIYELERRHHVNTSDQLIEIANTLRTQIKTIDDADETLKRLEAKARHAKAYALEMAREISEARHAEAITFANILRERALPLGMKNLNVVIQVTDADMSSTGIDAVEFLFAFNKNQTPLPVGKTASGGEISRIMLSIKSIVADKMELPSIIFDEVDTGVSGDVANRMGELMKLISDNIQVIAITHLPQVAAKGNAHFKVYKEDNDKSTNTHISRLDEKGREVELAIMLSGSPDDPAALAAARSIINSSQN